MEHLINTAFWNNSKVRDFLILLFFVFAVKFSFLPVNSARIVLAFALFSVFIINKDSPVFRYRKGVVFTFMIFILYACYISFSTLISGGSNLANLFSVILIISQFGLTAYLISNFLINEDINQLLFLLLLIFAFQGVLVFFNFLIPAYRDLMFTIMPVEGNITEDNVSSVFRTRGLMQSSGASVSALLSFGFLIAAYLYSSFNLSKQDKRVIINCLPWILIGVAFTGRTGLITIPLALLLYYLLLILNGKFRWKSLLLLLYIPMVAVFIYFSVKLVLSLFFTNFLLVFESWEKWAIGGLLANFVDSEKTSTLEVLSSYVFLPEDEYQLLFGDPNSWGVIRTDIGYIRMIFSVGIVGSLLFYSAITSIYVNIITTSKSRSFQLFVLLTFFWLLILEYKEPMNSHFYFVSLAMLLLFFSMKGLKNEKV